MPDEPQQTTIQPQTGWSDAEISSAVQAYLSMLHAELSGQPYNKAEVNRHLREGPLNFRTKAAVEFRMQNISAALYELKMPYIAGYLPARNIGSSVKDKMIAILHHNGVESLAAFVPTSDEDVLALRVSALRKRSLAKIPPGSSAPETITKTTTSFVRDPAVKAWVLEAAQGICEACKMPAPFLGQDGMPYLEVHHVMPLASQGSDTITNAAALCPNCHRRCHLSADRDEFKLALYERIPRLILEVSEPSFPDTNEFIDGK